MLSRKSLIASVVLIAGYIAVCTIDNNLKQEYADLATVTKVISDQAESDKNSILPALRQIVKKKKAWAIYEDDYLREKSFLELLPTNHSLMETTYGKTLLQKYDLNLSNLKSKDVNLLQIAISRSIMKSTCKLIDSLSLSDKQNHPQELKIHLQQESYAVGNTHALYFNIVSELDNELFTYSYNIGEGEKEVDSIPLVISKKPDQLTLYYKTTNSVTGEERKYKHRVYP